MVHEAKHPGDDIPPVPHASTWFSHLEDPSRTGDASSSSAITATGDPTHTSPIPRRTRRGHQANNRSASPANSDEIAIERERISLKCPLTLLPFTDPVTSTKCPHSFERQAIEDMINRSPTTRPAAEQPGMTGRRAPRVRCVQCPVCTVSLTLNDLKRDPVLLRRVRRAEAAMQREAEEDDFDGRGRKKGGRKSGFTVASDDDDDDDDENEDDAEIEIEREERIRIKRERSARHNSTARERNGDEEIEDS
jgi:hypothetical protein